MGLRVAMSWDEAVIAELKSVARLHDEAMKENRRLRNVMVGCLKILRPIDWEYQASNGKRGANCANVIVRLEHALGIPHEEHKFP